MSKKSRARTAVRRAQKQTADSLSLQKQNIKSSALEYLALAAAYVLIALLLCLSIFWDRLSHAKGVIILFIVAMCGFAVMFGIHAYRRFRIARLLKPIQFASEETVTFSCQQVLFGDRYRYRHRTCLLYVIFHAEDGRVFYYVYPDGGEISTLAVKELKQRLVGATLSLPCYIGTTVIKNFDPYQHIH